jgi:hypothetical protein
MIVSVVYEMMRVRGRILLVLKTILMDIIMYKKSVIVEHVCTFRQRKQVLTPTLTLTLTHSHSHLHSHSHSHTHTLTLTLTH